MKPLTFIKLLHTIIWVFFNGVIFYMLYAVLTNKLDMFLGFPKADPHGDPIPDSKGRMTITSTLSLQQLSVGATAVVTGVGDQSSSLLELLSQKNIGIGTKLEVKKKFDEILFFFFDFFSSPFFI